MTFPNQQTRLGLAIRVNEVEGLGVLAAARMVNHACAYGPASPHWDRVLPYITTWMNEMIGALRPLLEALNQAITDEARDGIRERERGRRMMANHPDLAALDAYFGRLYGDRETGG